jgi:hypothetical protein
MKKRRGNDTKVLSFRLRLFVTGTPTCPDENYSFDDKRHDDQAKLEVIIRIRQLLTVVVS